MSTITSSSPISFEIDWNLADAVPESADDGNTVPNPTTQRIEIPTSDSFAAPVINETARELAERESVLLAEHKIGASEQLYATGTALMGIGHASLERERLVYAALPTPELALSRLKATITAEDRKDTAIDLSRYRMDVDGKLALKEHACGGHGTALEETPMRQLTSTISGDANTNRGLSTLVGGTERRVRARSLSGATERSVFALVSADTRRGYSVFDAGTVADLTLAGLKRAGTLEGAKADVQYDAQSTRYQVRVILQAPLDIAAFRGVGRVHQIYMDVRGGDNGMASVEGSMGAIRIRCMNATLSTAKGTSWKVVHRGNNAMEIRSLVASMVNRFGVVAEEMQSLWANASAHYYLDSEGGRLSPKEAITRLVASKQIPTGGLETGAAIEAYMSAWRAEDSPASAAGIVMAIQRAAHETSWKTSWTDTEAEESASKLLHQPVYTLAAAR